MRLIYGCILYTQNYSDPYASAIFNFYFYCRLVPNLFYAVDHPQHDPVIAKAKDLTDEYLDPILHDWTPSSQPLLHGVSVPYLLNANTSLSQTTDSSLSRVLGIVVHQLQASTSKHLTVSTR